MAVNGYAAAQDVADLKTGVSALAIAMGGRVNSNEAAIAQAQAVADAIPGLLEELENSIAPIALAQAAETAADAIANMTYLGSGDDAVPIALSSKLSELEPSPEEFFLVIHADDTESIRLAIAAAAGGTMKCRRNKHYWVRDQLFVQNSNTKINLNGSTINVNPGNWTGAITRFYALFTTVNVTARPLTILWRIGTGIIAYEHIVIYNGVIDLHRDGSVLTEGQMVLADFNAVRFEDADSCFLKGVRIIDGMTDTNNNGTHAVFFVRSRNCRWIDGFTRNVTSIFIVESYNCIVENYDFRTSVGTAIETLGGSGHRIGKGSIDKVWWGVSTIGVNSPACTIDGPVLEESALSGLTLGHAGTFGANFYFLDANANYCTVNNLFVKAGGTDIAAHGYTGILIQKGSYITIGAGVRIIGLRKKAAYTDRTGGIVIQPDAAVDCVGIVIGFGVVIDGATNGIIMVRGDILSVGVVHINDTLCGFYYEVVDEVPIITLDGTTITNSPRLILCANGIVKVLNSVFRGGTNPSFSFAFGRGSAEFSKNIVSECGELYLFQLKSFKLTDSHFYNDSVTARAATMDNSDVSGTATIAEIEVHGNTHLGTTALLRLVNVLGQVDNTIVETTLPTMRRGSAFNFAGLPTTDGDFGSELLGNGDFSSGSSGWTLGTGWAVTSDATYTAATANSGLTRTLTAPAVTGKLVLRYTVTANTLNAGNLRVGGLSGNSFYGAAAIALPSNVGTHRVILNAVPVGTGSNFDLWVNNAATSGAITIDGLSLKQVNTWVLDVGDAWDSPSGFDVIR